MIQLSHRRLSDSVSRRGGEGRGWAKGHSRPCAVAACACPRHLPACAHFLHVLSKASSWPDLRHTKKLLSLPCKW